MTHELVKKELGTNSDESLFDTERQTERALMNVYRKIIKQYECNTSTRS